MKTAAQLQFLHAAERALRQLAVEHNVDVKIAIKADDSGISCRLQAGADERKALFDQYSWKFGYPKEWFDQQFVAQGVLYQIVGVKPTAEKNCLVIKRLKDGKEFVCPVGYVTLPKTQAA